MKKNFVKKLALAMALTLAVGSVPSMNVEAAAAPDFKSTQVNLKVGQTKKYNTVNSTKKSVKFVVGTPSIAKVTYKKGEKFCKITGVTAGKTRVRAEFKDYKTKDVIIKKMPVVVKAAETEIKAVAQNTTTKLTATFAGDTSAVKAENFSIVREDNSTVAVKSVAVDKTDATKVVIETYTAMKDGKTYTVTFNEKSNAQFVATDGKVANVNLDTMIVTAAKAETVKVQTLDAQNIVLGEYTMGQAGANDLEFTIDTVDGYVDGDKLYLTEVGKTATAKVVYHTWKYDTTGEEEGKIEREFTITAVKDATVISDFKFTIVGKGKTPAWNSTSFKANTSIAANDGAMNVFFNIKNSKGEEIDDYSVYTIASSDTSKLVVDETTALDDTQGVEVIGVEAGTAYILLKDADGNTVKTFPVTILANRKAATLLLSTSAFTLSKVAAAEDTKTVALTVKDQYGVEMAIDSTDVEVLSAPKDVDDTAKAALVGKKTEDKTFAAEIQEGKVLFTGVKFPVEGAYTFKIKATDEFDNVVSRTMTVNVKDSKATEASSYELVVVGVDAKNTVDLAVDADTITGTSISFKVAKKDSKGVLIGYETVTNDKYTVKHTSGTELKVSDDCSIDLSVVSDGAITVNNNVKTGTYNVKTTFNVNGKDKTIVKSFNVVDTQVAPTVVITDTDAGNNTVLGALAPSDKVTYYYDGVKYDGNVNGISVVKADYVVSGNKAFVKTVTINFPANEKLPRTITINVNKTFTNVQ